MISIGIYSLFSGGLSGLTAASGSSNSIYNWGRNWGWNCGGQCRGLCTNTSCHLSSDNISWSWIFWLLMLRLNSAEAGIFSALGCLAATTLQKTMRPGLRLLFLHVLSWQGDKVSLSWKFWQFLRWGWIQLRLAGVFSALGWYWVTTRTTASKQG